jgi:hypothetical protein
MAGHLNSPEFRAKPSRRIPDPVLALASFVAGAPSIADQTLGRAISH